MSEILMYNIAPKKSAGIKLLCSQLGIGYRAVEPGDFGLPIGCLLGISERIEPKPDSSFDDELLFLVDIQGDMFGIFLNMLRKRGLSVALKAVKTDTNIGFTSYELITELKAEHEAIQRGMTAHEQT